MLPLARFDDLSPGHNRSFVFVEPQEVLVARSLGDVSNVLDEVDAALDEANSERFAAILRKLAKQSQFAVITHNRATMHEGKVLYGVTMGSDGVSKLLSMDLEDAEAQAFANR